MRIAIDARLNAYRRGGIPQYTRQLVTALAALERNETFVTLQHRDHQRPLVVAPNVQRRTIFTPPHHRLEQWSLPLELLAVAPNVLHSPDFVVPIRRPCAAVVTVHDLAFLHYPEILDDAARQYYNQVRASVHNAEAVIAVSQSTRDDIASLLDLPPEQINVVHEAPSPSFKPLELAPGATRTIGNHTLRANSFALFVSTLEPRKNLPTLLKALRVCIDRRPDMTYRLAVAGARGWRYKPIFETVRELHLEDAVLFLDSVSDEDLRWLYSACVCYANPSLYEGFALPPLEAMACGAPTLVSATSSLPEVVGDAALLLPPLDVNAWADALELVWHDNTRRADLAARGPAQAATFSWQRAARQTMAIYRDALVRRDASPQRVPARATLSTKVQTLASGPLPPPRVPEPPPVPTAAQIEHPSLHATPMAGDLSNERLCLRCGAPLEMGVLIGDVGWRAEAMPQVTLPKVLQAWACAVCGNVELVLVHSTVIATNGQEFFGASPAYPYEENVTSAKAMIAAEHTTGNTLAVALDDSEEPPIDAPDIPQEQSVGESSMNSSVSETLAVNEIEDALIPEPKLFPSDGKLLQVAKHTEIEDTPIQHPEQTLPGNELIPSITEGVLSPEQEHISHSYAVAAELEETLLPEQDSTPVDIEPLAVAEDDSTQMPIQPTKPPTGTKSSRGKKRSSSTKRKT